MVDRRFTVVPGKVSALLSKVSVSMRTPPWTLGAIQPGRV